MSRTTVVAGLFVFGVLAATASWNGDQNVDSVGAAEAGFLLVHESTLVFSEPPTSNPWWVEADGGFSSNRPPGLILVSALAALVWFGGFSLVPSTLAALLLTFGSVVLVFVVVRREQGEGTALLTAAVLALAASTWSISANQLWPHGPGQFWAALVLLGASSSRYGLAGLGAGLAVLTRPITAVAWATFGIWIAVRERSFRPLVRFGGGAAAGLAALVVYNALVFGRPSISGGYSEVFVNRLTDGSVVSWAGRVVGMFVDPRNGVLVWSPWIVVALVAGFSAWGKAPSWMQAGGLAALVLMIGHAGANRVSGGLPFGYRYPLEALTLAIPILAMGVPRIRESSRLQRAAVIAITLGVVAQILLVFALECVPISASEASCGFMR